jgi:hypothetical protein
MVLFLYRVCITAVNIRPQVAPSNGEWQQLAHALHRLHPLRIDVDSDLLSLKTSRAQANGETQNPSVSQQGTNDPEEKLMRSSLSRGNGNTLPCLPTPHHF